MPTYRSIHLALHSQFDIEPFPEYLPEPRERYRARGITNFIPEHIDHVESACSVFVPVKPGSTFWITYSVEPPVPDGHYFLFKLYISGIHVVSWSTGHNDGWAGTTMFGMFESSEGDEVRKHVEKRVFCFTPSDPRDRQGKEVADRFNETARMDIKVHRASARKRVERALEPYDKTQQANSVSGIKLARAGRAGPDQPKRFYKFALIDPVDQPFATFRYYYRTWDQLQELGLLGQSEAGASIDDNLPVIEPQDASPQKTKANKSTADAKITPLSEQPCTYVPRGAPGFQIDTPEEEQEGERQSQEAHYLSSLSTPPRVYGVSVPPSMQLGPSRQSDSASFTACPSHLVLPGRNAQIRAPSPIQSASVNLPTPPLQKRRQRSAFSLMGSIPAVWRRLGNSSSSSSSYSSSGPSQTSVAGGKDGALSTAA